MTVFLDLLIGGRQVPARSGRTTDVHTPRTGARYAIVAAAGPEDVDAAVTAADREFAAWSESGPLVRRAIFTEAAALLEQRREQIADIMAAETGALRAWADFNAHLAAGILREAAAAVTAPTGEVLAAGRDGVLGMALRAPMGVVAAFAPWNAPVILSTRAVAAPLAAGNTVVLKASEAAPQSSGLLLAEVLRAAGLPAGVLNVLTNDPEDAAAIAETLIGDSRVRAVNFTGSTAVGRIIGRLAAEHLKPAVLELGGKNALIVLGDADVDYAVNAAVFGAFANSGQICMSADRILVHDSRIAEFTRTFAGVVAGLPVGDPDDPETVIGPLVSPAAARRVADLVDDALAHGATLLAGGGRPRGAHYPATVLSGVPKSARIHYGEAFGPVCVLDSFASDEEAIAKANDTENGLTVGILTENGTHGLRVARRIRTGIAHINDQSVADEPQVPFGGFGASGYGRFGGHWGIEAFSNTRWVTLATEHARFPG
ncbi:aldehyde dehydrogenase family protein [Nocardia panacis]|uniref:Aldehyde dehydrogenase family protein n=2 Tax=Nocardia panacis TaxID=2340916 RepID=A0A3A4L849_9NOCA|nr:aldehyde dehydrogenase family protein [Nocardia panacis]